MDRNRPRPVSIKPKGITAASLLSFTPTPVDIPELGGTVYTRPPSAGAVMDFVRGNDVDPQEAMFTLISKVIVDEKGVPLFTGSAQLREVRIDAFNRLAVAATGVLQLTAPEVAGDGGSGNGGDKGDLDPLARTPRSATTTTGASPIA